MKCNREIVLLKKFKNQEDARARISIINDIAMKFYSKTFKYKLFEAPTDTININKRTKIIVINQIIFLNFASNLVEI